MGKSTKPKIKGCYHCSQRRIDCDRTEPACLKCIGKGLTCPGLGVRYRFNAGLAARGRLVGKMVPFGVEEGSLMRVGEGIADGGDCLGGGKELPPIRWVGMEGIVGEDGCVREGGGKVGRRMMQRKSGEGLEDGGEKDGRKKEKRRGIVVEDVERLRGVRKIRPRVSVVEDVEGTCGSSVFDGYDIEAEERAKSIRTDEMTFSEPASPSWDSQSTSTGTTHFNDIESPPDPDSHSMSLTKITRQQENQNPQLCYSLETHDSQTRMLFLNYSENIAPAMMMFDGPYNQYRSILLPYATTNFLVRDAILATSAHHLSTQDARYKKIGLEYQTAVINRLTRIKPPTIMGITESDGGGGLGPLGYQTTAVLSALILLLVNDLVSAGNDYKILYQMMSSCMRIEEERSRRECESGKGKGRDVGSLMSFLRQQFSVMELFIQPLLGEEQGVFNLSTRFLEPLNFIAQDALLYPEHSATARIIEFAYQQASSVYVHRAINNVPPENTRMVVQRLMETLELVPIGSVGEHVLVWVYFVGAAESSIPEHRNFFRERLMQVYKRTGFENIRGSLKMLEQIWRRTTCVSGSGGYGEGDENERWTNVLGRINPVFVY